MLVRRLGMVAGLVVATAGCTSILGDFEVGDATTDGATGDTASEAPTSDVASGDRSLSPDSGSDATMADAGTDGRGPTGDATGDATADGPPSDAGCAPGLTRCATGCIPLDATTACGSCTNDCSSQLTNANVVGSSVGCTGGRCSYTCRAGYADCLDSGTGCAINLDDAAAHCGQCGHSCYRGACAASTCGAFIIAQQPTTGAVAKLATDGTRVLWADTNIVAIKQIPAAGGNAISLATMSTTYGQTGAELALAGGTVAFTYSLSGGPASVGLATVDMADSGTPVTPGALAVGGVSLNPAATHVFFVNTTGTMSNLNDCAISGREAGACLGIGDTGRFLNQTAADNAYLFFDLTGANMTQSGLYIDTIGSTTANIFTTDVAQSVAVDGSWAYWTELLDAGGPYTLLRTPESSPGTSMQTVASPIASSAFATDGVNVYYWTGSAIASKPVAGGTEAKLAQASQFTQIAVGGGLLVWTDGATIWGLVLPGH